METTITKETLKQIKENYLSMLEKIILTEKPKSILVIDAGECSKRLPEDEDRLVLSKTDQNKTDKYNKKSRDWTDQVIEKIANYGKKTGVICDIITSQQTRQLKSSRDKITVNPSLTSIVNNQTEKILSLYPHDINFLIKDCLLCESDLVEFIMTGLFQPEKIQNSFCISGLSKQNYICSSKKIFEITDFGDGIFKPRYSLNKIFEGGEISRRNELDETE